MNVKISAVIIAFNEEKKLENTLKKLYWVNEIVVIDSGSSDKTVEISEKFKAKVFYKKFNGFGEQKQYGFAMAKNDWILSIDADEVLTEDLIFEIQNQNFTDSNLAGFYLRRQHVFFRTKFNYGSESKKKYLRLFNRNMATCNSNKVHEVIETIMPTKILKSSFLHYSYDSIFEYLEKLNRYTSIYSEEKFKKNKKYNLFQIAIKTVFEFIKKYFFEFNFLNGKSGFYWSVFSMFYTYTKCVKTNEKFLAK